MIIFQNPGQIDPLTITTMGVSVKEEGSIGRFGTGMKFAIATILRTGGSIVIYSGETAYTFSTRPVEIRGETFDMVCMDGEPIGFTTQLGKDWLPWMAFRELASNCRDEHGQYFLDGDASWEIKEGMTTIFVTGDAMANAWADRKSIMLEGKPIYESEIFEIYEGSSPYVFFRGVRITQAPRVMAYTYNIKQNIELTEDRTAKSWFFVELLLERAVAAMEDKTLLRKILTVGEGRGEHHLNATEYATPSEAFREVAREITLGRETNHQVNPNVMAYARASAVQDMKPGDSADMSQTQRQMLRRAKEMLSASGFDVSGIPLIVCDTLGPNIHGMAKDGKIFITLKPFDKGTREVAATILEEYAHLKSGESDCTRGLQNWLFDQLLCRIEESHGEPF